MPGCLGLDAMWQLVGFYLGWLGKPGKGRALGVNTVKFTGEVLKMSKIATYIIDMKRILMKEGCYCWVSKWNFTSRWKENLLSRKLKVGLFK